MFVFVSTTSTDMLIGTAQLFVKDKSIVPPENVALEKFPILPPLNVPTLVSLTAGNGATKLEATILDVLIAKAMESARLIVTGPVEPGLVTELIFNPKLLGNVLPASELVWVEEPPLAATLEKLKDRMVKLVAVSTKSTPMLKGTGH